MKPGVDYVGVGVGAVIINNKSKFFLSKRGEKARNEKGLWHFPGGTLEFGEKLEDCIKREIKEEFGVDIKIIDSLEPFDHILPHEHQHWVAFCFVANIISGTPTNKEPEKCAEIGWFTLNEIEKLPLSSVSKIRIKQLKEKPHPRQ